MLHVIHDHITLGPNNENEALRWIKDAMRAGNFTESVHLRRDRYSDPERATLPDIRMAIRKATRIEPYTNEPPRHGGTAWRVLGPNLDETKVLAVGVEAYTREGTEIPGIRIKFVELATVIDIGKAYEKR